MEHNELFKNRTDLSVFQDKINRLRNEVRKVLVGQNKMVDFFINAILSDGHILIEGVPGIAKTLTAKLIARSLSVKFSRIQFTPDLMPSDILGTTVFNSHKAVFEFNRGAIFSNIILIDEINRAPAKTQSALFEVMEERQVTIDGKTYEMDFPFLVFATQNPIEHEGTYRLPEAQLDRFIFKINITYPTFEEENEILINLINRQSSNETEQINPVLNVEDIREFREIVKQIYIEPNLIRYISEIIQKTRNHPSLYLGASPRASIFVLTSGKAHAAMNGRDFVTPQDIQSVLVPVLNHRIYLTPEKELEGITPGQVISDIIRAVEIPK